MSKLQKKTGETLLKTEELKEEGAMVLEWVNKIINFMNEKKQ